MKDFIIIGTICKIYQKNMIDDISRTVFINCKSKEKYDNNDYSKNDFIIRSAKDPTHICYCIWLSTIKRTVTREFKLKKDCKLSDYKKYIGTEIINVDKITEIPDYDGLMGVNISILCYPQNQFDILGLVKSPKVIENGKEKTKFARVLIKKK